MVTVKDVAVDKFIDKLKEELKKEKEIKSPEWVKFIKSGSHKERPPEQEDFWFIRTSSILRRIYLDGPIGVERLRTFYGGRKTSSTAPSHFKKSGGSIIRKIIQQLEKTGLIEKANRKGRRITPKGRRFLDKIAYEVSK